MDVVLVIPVRAGTEHGHESCADAVQHFLARLARNIAVGERERAAIGEFETADIERIGKPVLRQSGAFDAVAATALEGIEIVQFSETCAEVHGQRRHVAADPVRNRGRHRAAQNGGRLDRHLLIVGDHNGLKPHQIVTTACARPLDCGNRGRNRNCYR